MVRRAARYGNAPDGALRRDESTASLLHHMSNDNACSVELALDVLGGKWRVVILAQVKEQPCRYADLRRLVPQMSEKMLTQRLRELIGSGLLERNAGVYTLSRFGESARPVLQALYDWGDVVRVAGPAASPAAETPA